MLRVLCCAMHEIVCLLDLESHAAACLANSRTCANVVSQTHAVSTSETRWITRSCCHSAFSCCSLAVRSSWRVLPEHAAESQVT